MEVLTTTPFGQRPVTAGLIDRVRAAQARPDIPHAGKWELFRELCEARAAFGVSDRDLTVLNALLSFHPEANLSDNDSLVVFPSNAALCARAHGMAESTLRRHLAALVNAGLILRHDSPNGKRYAVRDADGDVARAFGFDLRPLLVQARDIALAATEARAAAEAQRRLREEMTLIKRDAVKLAAYGQESHPHSAWEGLQSRLLALHKTLRRKLPMDELQAAHDALRDILDQIHRLLAQDTEEMSGNDAGSGRHHQNSKPDSYDLELCQEPGEGGAAAFPDHPAAPTDPEETPDTGQGPRIPLHLVLKACPDLLPYAQGEITQWSHLVEAASFVRGMMGVSPDAWRAAVQGMGAGNAAITVACILQRISDITSPGGYLRALTRKAEEGRFAPGPMVMALLNTPGRTA